MLLLAGAVLAGASWAATEALDTRQIRTPLVAPEDTLARDLTAADLTVLFDRRVQTRLDIHRADPEGGSLQDEHAWRVVVYFDAPLSTPDGLRQAALLLSREAETLTHLGPTEIVLADPQPYRYLAGSRDALALKDALRDVRSQTPVTAGELVWHRQRFSARLEGGDSQVSRALGDEMGLIDQQRQSLLRWLAGTGPVGPGLLILVQNGFDLNPGPFYSDQTAGSFLEDPRSSLSQSVLSKALATVGWTVMCLALGPRPEEFADPLAPLFELAHASGGEVITRRREGSRMLHRVSSWPILEVELTAAPDTGAQPFEVLMSSPQRKLRTRRWAAAAPLPILSEIRSSLTAPSEAPRPVLQLLRPEGLTLEGEVRFRTITGRQHIHRVVFLLDGVVVAETQRTPYSALVDLGIGVQPHTVSAIAYCPFQQPVG